MFTDEQVLKIALEIDETPGKIFLGCDSVKFKKRGTWFARYAVVLVLHINDCNGCRVWGYIDVEPSYDVKMNKPRQRLMTEVYKVAECYLAFAELLEDREIEIHLDVSPDPAHGSNVVTREAIGYILGMTGTEPKVKPEAFAASYAADAGARHDWYNHD